MKFTTEEFLEKLPLEANKNWPEGVWDIELFKKGAVSLVFFAPKNTDHQNSHDEDEFYFIATGTSELVIDGQRFECAAGDSFFVPKLSLHRFENFSDDFATWAVFF